jgi:uncharacterized protein YyaL (SSP411 family)
MNRLANSTSPYLLQHAHNPVDWYEWGEEAIDRAKREDRPIFLSIGYAACHWCHVMAHESFENPETAGLMNDNFVNIKVDREQRPDLDSIYMAATVAMTGSGGWPMSVFLTPDLQPFYTGTYFPSESRYNLPSFRNVLTSITRAWQEERSQVEQVGGQVAAHLRLQPEPPPARATVAQDLLEGAVKHLHDDYDWGFGGWGRAPKFPQPMTIEFLLRRASASLKPGHGKRAVSRAEDDPALKPALHALRAMARGGMYDVVAGGFSRYSTDIEWRVPHFEKMLYDNAQLALVYLHAWQITGEQFYRRILEETLGFVIRELTAPEGGFYSSLDADSEGEEGKFYVWSFDEIKDVLGEDLALFESAYFVAQQGNWEGRIILQRALDDSTLAARFNLPLDLVVTKLEDCHTRLLAARSLRPRPATDDKVLTAWNGLMLSAFAQAARAQWTVDPDLPAHFLEVATRNADFILTSLRPDGQLRRAWRAGKASSEVFLEDYAALICGLLDLYEADFDNRWFSTALELADEMMGRFDDPSGGFFDTPVDGVTGDGHPPLLYRPKDLQDNATPCGNSLACDALLRLAALTDRADMRQKAEEMLGRIAGFALRQPTSFGRWLQTANFALGPVKQVAVVGDLESAKTRALIAETRRGFYPQTVTAASSFPIPENAPPLLHDRSLVDAQPAAYVCEGFVCKLPVTSADALRELL